ncbi:hypothetical protein BgiBS90_014713, partial [Biomphalaria glabrata]
MCSTLQLCSGKKRKRFSSPKERNALHGKQLLECRRGDGVTMGDESYEICVSCPCWAERPRQGLDPFNKISIMGKALLVVAMLADKTSVFPGD